MATKLATALAAKLPTAKLATDVKPADTPAAGLAADLAAELAARPGMLAPRYVPEPTPFDRQIDSAIRFHFGPSVSSEGIKSGLFLGGPAWNPADLEAAKALPKSKLGTRLVPDASW